LPRRYWRCYRVMDSVERLDKLERNGKVRLS
jgi:hypothetical protein